MEEGAESVVLLFRTTPELPGDSDVEWSILNKMAHVYINGSDQPEDQDPLYRNRTNLNEDLLESGDLSLTLKTPTKRDSGDYKCILDSRSVWRVKTSHLKVKGWMFLSFLFVHLSFFLTDCVLCPRQGDLRFRNKEKLAGEEESPLIQLL